MNTHNLNNWHKTPTDNPKEALYLANRWDSEHLFAQLTYTPEDGQRATVETSLYDCTLEDVQALVTELTTWLKRVEAGERYAHIEGHNPAAYTHYTTGEQERMCPWKPEAPLPATPVAHTGRICPNCAETYSARIEASLAAHPAKGGGRK